MPTRRSCQAALKELAKEQDHLIERGRELLQKLTREKADEAAKDTRASGSTRWRPPATTWRRGNRPGAAQAEAVGKLDSATDKLDAAADKAGRQLSDEKRRKLADQVKALLERQPPPSRKRSAFTKRSPGPRAGTERCA